MLAGVRLPSLGTNDSHTGLGYKVAALTYWTAFGETVTNNANTKKSSV